MCNAMQPFLRLKFGVPAKCFTAFNWGFSCTRNGVHAAWKAHLLMMTGARSMTRLTEMHRKVSKPPNHN
jgi:hypothetical protein